MAKHRAPAPSLLARIGYPLVIAALALLAGIGALSAPTTAHTTGNGIGAFPTWADGVAACQEEDGSTPGQPFPCRWERGSNGIGAEYTLTEPICSLEQVAASDAAHRAGHNIDIPCDDAESQGVPN